MNRLNRLLNRLHPYAPKGQIDSLLQLAEAGALPSWCDYKIYEEGLVQSLDQSRLLPVSDEDYFLDIDVNNKFSLEYQPKLLFKLENARVIGRSADIVSMDNHLLPEFTPQNFNGGLHSAFLRRRFQAPVRLVGKTFNLVSPFSANYYHWIAEALPRLRSLGHAINSVDHFLIPKPTKFHLRSLELLGIDSNKLVEVADQTTYVCDVLLAPTYQTSLTIELPVIKWLRTVFGVDVNSRLSGRGERIYIMRGDAGWRQVSNEDDVINLVKQFGFQPVELAQMDLKDQVELFSRVGDVISIHGAGLTNLVFAPAETRLFEIHPPRWTSVAYVHLCDSLGFDYHYCNAEPLGLSAAEIERNRSFVPRGYAAQAEGIEIPMDKLKLFLNILD